MGVEGKAGWRSEGEPPGPGACIMPRLERAPQKGEKSLRAEQIVSEMVAEALSDNTGRPFEETFAEVLETPAGRRLVSWQAGLLGEREAQRPARLCTSEGGHSLTP